MLPRGELSDDIQATARGFLDLLVQGRIGGRRPPTHHLVFGSHNPEEYTEGTEAKSTVSIGLLS